MFKIQETTADNKTTFTVVTASGEPVSKSYVRKGCAVNMMVKLEQKHSVATPVADATPVATVDKPAPKADIEWTPVHAALVLEAYEKAPARLLERNRDATFKNAKELHAHVAKQFPGLSPKKARSLRRQALRERYADKRAAAPAPVATPVATEAQVTAQDLAAKLAAKIEAKKAKSVEEQAVELLMAQGYSAEDIKAAL